MKTLYKTALAGSVLFASSMSAFAGESPKTVVELFTSQGCSSCPPANAFINELSGDDDKLVLSYGVTYWDFLGWKDTFGDPEFTARQKLYGESLGVGYIYTPQIVVNGTQHAARYKRRDVDNNLLTSSKEVSVDLVEIDGHLRLNTKADSAVIVTFMPGPQTIDVERGENQGRTLRLSNVVTDVQPVTSGVTDISVKDDLAYAALVHDPNTFEVVGVSVLTPG